MSSDGIAKEMGCTPGENRAPKSTEAKIRIGISHINPPIKKPNKVGISHINPLIKKPNKVGIFP